MVFKKRARTTKRMKRNSRRTRQSAYNPLAPSKAIAIAKPSINTTFVYETCFVGNKVGGNTCGYGLLRLNSLYDPEYTSLGKNKPVQGLTQMGYLYNKYKVLKAKVNIEMVNAASKALLVGFATQNDLTSTGVTDKVTNIGTRKNGKTTMIGYLTENRHQNFTFDIAKTLGLSKAEYDNEEYAAFCSTNPTAQLYLVYAIGQIGEGTDENLSVYFKVRITYYTNMFDPIEVTDTV